MLLIVLPVVLHIVSHNIMEVGDLIGRGYHHEVGRMVQVMLKLSRVFVELLELTSGHVDSTEVTLDLFS